MSDNNGNATFLAIMATCVVLACLAGLAWLPADGEIKPLTLQEKQAVVDRW